MSGARNHVFMNPTRNQDIREPGAAATSSRERNGSAEASGQRSAGLSRRRFLGQSALLAAAGFLTSRVLAQNEHRGPGPTAAPSQPPTPESAGALNFDGPVNEVFWRKVRAQFNLAGGLTFLNNGTLGPVPRSVRDTHERWDTTLAGNPTDSFRPVELDGVRKQVARFINAAPEEIALTRSTTEGINIFAHGLDWQAGDEVVLGNLEHFAATDAYRGLEKRNGIKLVTVELPLLPKTPDEIVAAYEKAITARTRVIVVSHVAYVNGLLLPIGELAALAHRRNLLISVDGAQSLGALPLDVQREGIDHYASPGQKWLLAGTGTGFTYVRKDLQERIHPLMGVFEPNNARGGRPSARRYEQNGQYNIPAALGIGTALEFQQAVGLSHIEARVHELGTALRRGVLEIQGVQLWTPGDPRLAANITSLSIGTLTGQAIAKALLEREGIVVRGIQAAGINGIRVSTHLYNSPDEVDHLLAALRTIAAHPEDVPNPIREPRV